MVQKKIWEDTFYTSTEDSLVYKIKAGNNYIFQGKAYKMPNESSLRICVNKICQDFLYQDIDSFFGNLYTSSQVNSGACIDFYLQNSAGTTLETYRFLYNWDYESNWGNFGMRLSAPINGHYAPLMWRLRTDVTANGVVTTTRNAENSGFNTIVCSDYFLYYVNARGGWDSFAFEGRCSKVDNLTEHNFNRSFDNNTKEFGLGRYISEVSTTYTLNTGILTEEQAMKVAKHLISSPKCYLHIANEYNNKIIPVVITNNVAEYKKEGDDDIINYEITVKESQEKIRR